MIGDFKNSGLVQLAETIVFLCSRSLPPLGDVTKMADAPAPAPKSPEATGVEYAGRINDAVTRNDSKLYSDTMSDIKDWTTHHVYTMHPEFEEALIGNVDLKTAALYETKTNFNKIDLDGDKRVGTNELWKHATSPDSNALQTAMIKREILPNYGSIANNSSNRLTGFLGERDEHIREVDLDKGLQTAGSAKPAKTNSARTVEESTEQFLKLIDNPNLLDLNKFDVRANSEKARVADTSTDAGLPPGRLTKAAIETSLLKQQAPSNGGTTGGDDLTTKDTTTGKDGRLSSEAVSTKDSTTARDVVIDNDATTGKLPKPNDELLKLATVRRGEGPWHSAERILSAHGNKAGVDEVRSLAKAFKEIAADGGLQHMSDLKVNHNFINNDNFGKLLTKVTNPKAKEALLRFMAK